jgi:hypothetical protein
MQKETFYPPSASSDDIILLVPVPEKSLIFHVRFEVFTAVTMKNGVFWDITPCGSCKNGCFGGT